MSGQQYSVGENSGYFQHGQVDSSMLDLNCSPSTMNETEDNTNSELLELGRIWDFEIDVNEFNKQFQVVIAAESTANVPTMIQQNEVQKPTDQEAMIFDSPSSGESSQSSSHKLDSPERQLKKKPLSPYMLYSKENFHMVKPTVHPCNASNVGRVLGTMWNNLPLAEKQIYVDKANELKQQGGSTTATGKPFGVKKKTQKKPSTKKSQDKILSSVRSTELSNGSFADASDSLNDIPNEIRPLSLGRPTSVESRWSTDSSRSPLCPSYIPQNLPQQHQHFQQILPESQRSHQMQSFHVGQSFETASQQAVHAMEGNYIQQPLYQPQMPQSFAFQNSQSTNVNHLRYLQGMNPHSFRSHPQMINQSINPYQSNQQMSCAQSNFHPVNSIPNDMATKQGLDMNDLMNILRVQNEEIRNLKNRLRSTLTTNYNLLNILGNHGLLGSIQNGHQN